MSDFVESNRNGNNLLSTRLGSLVGCMAPKQDGTIKVGFENGVFMGTRPSALCIGSGYAPGVKNLTEVGGWKLGTRNVQECARKEVDWNDNAATKTGINEKNSCLVGASFFHPMKAPQESVNEETFTWILIKARFVHPCLVSSREVWRKKVKEKTSTQPQIRHEWKKTRS